MVFRVGTFLIYYIEKTITLGYLIAGEVHPGFSSGAALVYCGGGSCWTLNINVIKIIITAIKKIKLCSAKLTPRYDVHGDFCFKIRTAELRPYPIPKLLILFLLTLVFAHVMINFKGLALAKFEC